MLLARPGRPLPGFVQGCVVAVPDVAWIAPFPDPRLASSHGIFQPTLGQLSTAAKFAGTLGSVLCPGTRRTGKTGEVLVVGTANETAGIGNPSQVDFGRRRQDLAVPHVATLAPSSIHLVGRPLPIPSRPPQVQPTEAFRLSHGSCAAQGPRRFDSTIAIATSGTGDLSAAHEGGSGRAMPPSPREGKLSHARHASISTGRAHP